MWPLAKITFLEGLRSRIVFGVFLFSLLLIGASLVFINFFMHNLAKIAIDFNLAAISFAGLLLSMSITVNMVSKDLHSRTIYFVLSKPISRTTYIFGKFLGITLLTFLVYFIICLFAGATLYFLENQYQRAFQHFSWLACIQAVFFDFIKISLFNSLIILFSTITSSPFITMLFSISSYVIGQSLSTIVEYLSLDQTVIVSSSTVVKPFVDVLSYILPNFSLFDNKLLAAHNILLPASETLLLSVYGIGYTLILLCLGAFIFNKKELS